MAEGDGVGVEAPARGAQPPAADANVGAVRNIVVGVRVTCLFPTGEEKSNDKDQKKSYKISRKNPRYKCRCLGGPYFYYY